MDDLVERLRNLREPDDLQNWEMMDEAADEIERLRRAIADEREACAKVCDEADKSTHPADLAAAIRAATTDGARAERLDAVQACISALRRVAELENGRLPDDVFRAVDRALEMVDWSPSGIDVRCPSILSDKNPLRCVRERGHNGVHIWPEHEDD